MTIGAGGMLQAGAVGNDSSSPALFVATTPCRLLDTRDAPETVGPRDTPLRADDTFTTTVIGTPGCALPTDATTLVMNVAATDQTASSFLTVYGDGTRPLASSLNWDITSGDTANAVTANVSASGELSFYNLAGTTNIVADVVGYYTSTALDHYYTKAEVDAMIADNPGSVGATGLTGPQGDLGLTGPQGDVGPTGPMSTVPGPAGPQGDVGPTGPVSTVQGPIGPQGEVGPVGPVGPVSTVPGPTGASGSGVAALFYAMMPGDNSTIVAVGGAIDFPNSGPNTDVLSIYRMGADANDFVLAQAGVYRVSVQVSIDEPAQLAVALNGTPRLLTTVGRATGTNHITMDTLITTAPGDVLSVTNVGTTAFMVTQGAGGTNPVSATLLIELVTAQLMT